MSFSKIFAFSLSFWLVCGISMATTPTQFTHFNSFILKVSLQDRELIIRSMQRRWSCSERNSHPAAQGERQICVCVWLLKLLSKSCCQQTGNVNCRDLHELRFSELGVWGQGGFVPEERLIPNTKNWKQLWNKICEVAFSLECYFKCIFCIMCLITDNSVPISQQKEGKAIYNVSCFNLKRN